MFQSHCVVATSISVFGAAVLSHFCPLSNLILISIRHLFVVNCIMSCVCVGFVGVCCMMSSDGVWGVDDAVCLAVHSQKRQHSTRPCLHVMVCTNTSCCMVWWVSVSVWCGVVVWWVLWEKGKRQRHSQTKTKKTFPKTTFSLFPFFPSSFSSTLFSLPSTLPPSLPSYPYTHLFFMLHT